MVFLRKEVEDVMQWERLQVRFANRQAPCLNMFTMTRHTDQLTNDRGLIRSENEVLFLIPLTSFFDDRFGSKNNQRFL
jgi:hypothetical protein